MKWFRRLAEVPGISYEGSARMNRNKLTGRNAKPTVETAEFSGEPPTYLSWPLSSDGFYSSPVRRYSFGDAKETSPAELTRRIEEALELPGELADYHAAILAFCGAAYGARKAHPKLLQELVRFCLLDIDLVETYPESITFGDEQYMHVPAFSILIGLYQREGYLEEALGIAERGLACKQELEKQATELRERVAALQAEDADRNAPAKKAR
jgi:hypothetical protein